MKKTIQVVLNGLGVILGSLSLVLLINHAIKVSWVDSLQRVLDYYNNLKKAILWPLESLLHDFLGYISKFFQFQITLLPQWSDVFVLLFLYFGARVRAYWDAGFRKRALFRFFWGLVIAISTAVIGGILPLTGLVSSAALTVVTLLGITIFEIGDCACSATFSRKAGLTWREDFKRYAAFGFPPIIIGVAVLLSGVLVTGIYFPNQRHLLGVILLFILIVIFAFYWLLRGWQFAGDSSLREIGESQWDKFKRSSNTRIGTVMLGTIAGTLIFLLLNAGLGLVNL